MDDTVVWEHSLSFIEECIKHNVQVDYFPYPTDPHNVGGRRRIHLMDKVTMYFEDYLLVSKRTFSRRSIPGSSIRDASSV